MKIVIIGSPGSGKSTLAYTLHDMLKLPLYHLDQYFWLPGWQRPDRAEFEKIHNALCDGEYNSASSSLPSQKTQTNADWIIEGMATRYFEYRAARADIIIFLDVSRYMCFYRILKRALMHFGKEHASSPKGCPEKGPTLEFLKYIWHFNRKQKPEIEDILQKYHTQKQIFVIKNQTDYDALIEHMKRMI